MRNLIFLFALLWVVVPVTAQDHVLDSLLTELKAHPKHDSLRFKILIMLSDQLEDSPSESRAYIDEALELARNIGFTQGIAEAQYCLAHYFFNRTDYPKAIDHGLSSLKSYENIHDQQGMFEACSVLSGIYVSMKDADRANHYINKMLSIGANKEWVDEAILYQNMGFLYLKLNDTEKGVESLKKALTIYSGQKDDEGQSNCYLLLGRAHEHSSPQEALVSFQKALQANRGDNPRAQSIKGAAHEGIGAIYVRLNQFEKAKPHLDTALAAGKQIKNHNLIIRAYKAIILMYERQRDYEKALVFERLKTLVTDSIFNKESAELLAEAQTRYETEKKERTIQLLEQDKRIEAITRNVLIAILMVGIFGGIAFYRTQRFREQKNRELLNLRIDCLTAKHQELLESRQSITDQSHHVVESQDDRFLKKALDVVEQNISDPKFSVEKMAEEIGTSRANLLRKLKSSTGFAPSDFIRSVRLKRAAMLLQNQVDSVSQISYMVGFEDQSYFSKSFRKHFGTSPTEYIRIVDKSHPDMQN